MNLKVVYFPSCINRSMGKSHFQEESDLQLTALTHKLLTRAGYEVIYPENLENLCCGMPFSSKGFVDENRKKSDELEEALWQATDKGKYPVLYDMSPCFYHSKTEFKRGLKIVDPFEFMLDYVMPQLKITKKKESIVVFPVCSVKKIGKEAQLIALSNMCANNVTVIESNCCGFAGDRGFSFPELNEHGLRDIKQQIPAGCNEGYSTSRTCEIGLEKASGIRFRSVFYLVEEASING